MTKYPVSSYFPSNDFVRGIPIRWIQCVYCRRTVLMTGDMLKPHRRVWIFGKGGPFLIHPHSKDRKCPGGNRFYWNILGTPTTFEANKLWEVPRSSSIPIP